MSYQEYLERTKQRNLNLWNYHLRYPDMTQEALAKVFKLSQERVSRILKRFRGDDGNNPANKIMSR